MAENLVPALGALNLHYNVNIIAGDEIPAGVIPNDEDVVRETHRLLQIQRVQEEGGDANNGGLNEADYAGVVIRQHKVVSVRADNEIGNTNAAILNQLGQIQIQLNAMNARMIDMNARMIADGARFFNSHIDSRTARTTNFSRVVKYIPNHPAVVLEVPDVHFEDEYAINTLPPDGLMPLNFEELDTMGDVDNLAQLRRRLLAIYWFYNDPRLALGPKENRAQCNNVLRSLIRFITFP